MDDLHTEMIGGGVFGLAPGTSGPNTELRDDQAVITQLWTGTLRSSRTTGPYTVVDLNAWAARSVCERPIFSCSIN